MADRKVTRPETMAVIFAEILGNLSVIVNSEGEPAERLDQAAAALEKAWKAVEHFARSLALMGGIELTGGNVEAIKRAWLRSDPAGHTFKDKIAQMMRGF